MDGFFRAIKQNVIVSGLVIVLVLGFLGVVVIPGMTGGTGSSTSTTNASVASAGSQKVEVQGAKTPTQVTAVTNASPTVAVNANTGTTPVATATVVVQAAGEYVVKSGDTLSDIAQSNGTTVDALVSVNGLANVNAISIGQKLQIPGSSTSSQNLTTKPTNTPVQANSNETPVSTATARPTNTPGLPTRTPTPRATNTPKPTNTAVPPTATTRPAVDYTVKSIHRLTGCENHGMLRTNIKVLDKNGNPLDGINVVRYTNTGDYAGNSVTGDKGPGTVEFDNAGPGMGGNWHAVIEMPGQTSETAFNLRTDLGAEDMPDHMCGDEDGSYFKHISYDVVFQKTN